MQAPSLSELYGNFHHRVEECISKAPAIQQCQELAEQLYQAMKNASIDDIRTNTAGENNRIMARAMAMKQKLEELDPFIKPSLPEGWTSPLVGPDTAMRAPAVVQAPKPIKKNLNKDEEEEDASPEQCVSSICLLQAALFERTPFSNSELRKKIYQDFSILKRDFRSDSLNMLHGNTSSIGHLFDSIKDMDKRGKTENLIGILFEDWQVHQRVSPFILADQLKVQVRHQAAMHVPACTPLLCMMVAL